MDLPPRLLDLLGRQDGLVTRRQLRSCGVSDDQVRWALGRRWQMVLPGVVAAFTGRLDDHQRLVAGALFAGESAVLSGPAAARWHAVASVPRTEYLHFLVPATMSARAAGPVIVKRTTRPDQKASSSSTASRWSRSPRSGSAPTRTGSGDGSSGSTSHCSGVGGLPSSSRLGRPSCGDEGLAMPRSMRRCGGDHPCIDTSKPASTSPTDVHPAVASPT